MTKRSRRNRWVAALAAGLIGILGTTAPAQESGFQPMLVLTLEYIDGGQTQFTQLPADVPEAQTYKIEGDLPRPLVTELPGKPLKQVSPPPRSAAWWKYPFYLVLGLPRDLADSVVGAFSKIPIISVPVYAAYEVVPTQILLRDHRDWHRWDGDHNRNDHGFYDGISWGFFPSAHQWDFTYASKNKLAKHTAYNDTVREEIDRQNREIERGNQAISARQRTARREALAALDAGNGKEAVSRMLPFALVYKSDEGSFALLVTSLALYSDNGPDWVAPLLWSELNRAQPLPLEQAEKLLTETLKKHPESPGLTRATIYARTLRADHDAAFTTANRSLLKAPKDNDRLRLEFETALATRQTDLATTVAQALDTAQFPAGTAELMRARLLLLQGDTAGARAIVAPMLAAEPENPYLGYYMGCIELITAEKTMASAEGFKQAFALLEKSALQAPHPALRNRAGQALAYARGVQAKLEDEGDNFIAPKMVPPGKEAKTADESKDSSKDGKKK